MIISIKDQYGIESFIGDYVIHLMPGAGKELIVSKIIGFRGKTKVVLDLDRYGCSYTEKFVKVPSDWGKEHYEPHFTKDFEYMTESVKRIKVED
jgi:hypothetical protein